jgi:hypothetical protein
MSLSPSSEAFAHLLKFHLKKAKISGNAFAKATQTDPTMVSRVLSSDRYPPEDLESWVNQLDLAGDERERFLEAGYLTRCHPFIVQLVERLKKQQQTHRKG